MSTTAVNYSINLQNNTATQLRSFSNGLQGVNNQVQGTSSRLGNLQNSLGSVGINTTDLTDTFKNLGGLMVSPIGLAAVATGAVVALGGLALSTASTAAHVMDLSDNSGVAASTLMKFRNVAELGNVDLDTLSGSLFKLSKNMIENGSGWKSLGIKSRDTIGAFTELKIKVAEANTPLEAQEIAMKGLGKSAEALMPLLKMNDKLFQEVLGNTTGWTQEQIEAGAALDDQLVIMKQSLTDLKDSVGNLLIPVFNRILNIVKDTWNMWKDMLTTDPSTRMQNEGMAVKVNMGSRIGTQSLSMSNINNEDAQSKLKALSSTELLDLSVWARIEKNNDELANHLVKMSNAKKEEIRAAEEKALSDQRLADQNKKIADQIEEYNKKWDKIRQDSSYSVFAENKKIENYKSQRQSENQARYESENPTQNSLNSDWAMKQSLGNIQGYDKGIGGNINPLNYKNPLHQFANSQKPGTGGYTSEEQLNSDQIKKISEAIAKERMELEAANREFSRQKEIIASITGTIESGLVQPFDNFVRHIGSGNKSISGLFKGLFSDIQDSFSNLLANLLSQMLAKAALFGLLNILSGGGFSGATSLLNNFKWFASGTDYNPSSGMAFINERSRGGREAVYLPQGASVKKEVSNSTVNNFSIHIEKGMDENEVVYKLESMLEKRDRVYR